YTNFYFIISENTFFKSKYDTILFEKNKKGDFIMKLKTLALISGIVVLWEEFYFLLVLLSCWEQR
ncbi:TPA: hypothetical protein ACHH3T_001714, partial [Streptococcus pneumoniae]